MKRCSPIRRRSRLRNRLVANGPGVLIAAYVRRVERRLMIMSVVFLVLVACALTWRQVRAIRRRREARTMVVSTYPGIELEQPYGGWNADAYDAHTGHDHSPGSPFSAGRAYASGRAPSRRR